MTGQPLDPGGVHPTLADRVCGEYLEMPGLRLNVAQAARLWNLDVATTQQILNVLVDASFLRRSGEYYVRGSAGPKGFGTV